MSYYKRQLEKLSVNKDEPITITLSDYEGNKTNYMSVNLESIPDIRNFLDKVETILKGENKDEQL